MRRSDPSRPAAVAGRSLRLVAILGVVGFASGACSTDGAPRAPVLQEGIVDLDGDRLHFQESGRGPALVLVNDGFLDLRQWDEQHATLAAEFRVIRFDARGRGRSSTPTSPYSEVDDLRRMLEARGVERAALVGVASGAALAVDFALARPRRVSALVLVGPTLREYPWSDAFRQRGARLADARERSGAEGFAEALLRDPHFVPLAARQAGLAVRVRRLVQGNFGESSQEAARFRLPEPPAIGRLHEIRAPALILVPALDHPDMLGVARLLKKRLARSTLVSVPRAGHMVHLEDPERFNAAVMGFLRSLR